MIPRDTLNQMVRTIHSFDELQGCIIGLHGNNQCTVLDTGMTPSINYGRCAVIIEEVIVADAAVTNDTQHWADAPGASPEGATNPIVVTNRSVWGREAIGAGLSCGMTVVAAVGVVGGVAGEIPTGGVSTFLVVASWAGMITAGIQCVNGIVRVGAIVAAPDENTLQRWDSSSVYPTAMLIVDAVGLASGIASLPSAGRNLWAILVRRGGLAQRGLTEASLRAMNRAERARIIQELVTEASRTPEGRAAIMAAAREAQVGAASLARPASLSVRNATRMVNVIGAETTRRLSAALLNVVSVPGAVILSAQDASRIGSASGSINWLIHIVDTGTEA